MAERWLRGDHRASGTGRFRYFPLLPKELRDLIWEFAALPSGSGIHFLQLVTDAQKEGDSWKTQCRLEKPQVDEQAVGDGAASWFADNPSSYLEGLAVWDACCESRHVLTQLHARRQRRDRQGRILSMDNLVTSRDLPFGTLRGWEGEDQRRRPCTCAYRYHHPQSAAEGAKRPLLFNLEDDIICLKFDLSLVKFHDGGREITEIPDLRALDGYPVRRLAIEWNPKWDADRHDEYSQDDVQTLTDFLRMFSNYTSFPRLRCVYFIDYRIKPAADAGSWDGRGAPGAEVFRGPGAAFHEVAPADQFWQHADTHPFTLASALQDEWKHCRKSLEKDDPENPTVVKLKADKWALGKEEACQFKVLASWSSDTVYKDQV